MSSILNNILIGNLPLLQKLYDLQKNETVLEYMENGEKKNTQLTMDLAVDYLLIKVLRACTMAQCNGILDWQEEGIMTKIGHKGAG